VTATVATGPGAALGNGCAKPDDVRPARPVSRTRKRWARTSLVHASCIVVSVGIFGLPMVYVVLQAFKSDSQFTLDPLGWPSWTFATFRAAWDQGDFARQLVNSTIYSFFPDVISLILGVFLAFPIARGYLKHSLLWYSFFVFQGFLPPALIPLFLEAKALHMYNNMVGYVLLRSLYGAGFFFFVAYLRGIPREREEAAALDGCGYIRFIFTIIMPEMAPALAAFGVFGFILQWNELIAPIILLPNANLFPVTRGLYGFFSTYSSEWPLICAATVIVALPLVVVFVVLQRYIVAGVAGGATGLGVATRSVR
jgi:raffinose/stachyose/melibiose transport system permease protein